MTTKYTSWRPPGAPLVFFSKSLPQDSKVGFLRAIIDAMLRHANAERAEKGLPPVPGSPAHTVPESGRLVQSGAIARSSLRRKYAR